MNKDAIQINNEEIEACKIRFNVVVTASEIAKEFYQLLKKYNTEVTIPGFRLGKSPKFLIEKRFAKQIYEQVRQSILHESFQKIITENGEPISDPKLDEKCELSKEKDFSLSISLEFPPTIEVPEYKNIKVSTKPVVIEDSTVDNIVDAFCKSRKTYNVVERPAEKEDMLKITYTSVFEDCDVNGANKNILEGKKTWLVLQDPEMLPGTTELLTGKSAGDKLENVEINFPENFMNQPLAGKTGKYNFEIHEVQEPNVPELTDEIAVSIGLESKEKFIEQIRNNLVKTEEQKNTSSILNQIVEHLETCVDFALPASMLKAEISAMCKELTIEKEAEIKKNDADAKLSDEDIEAINKDAKEKAAGRLRVSYLLWEIAKIEKVKVTKQDLDARFSAFAQQFRQSIEAVRKYYKKDESRLVSLKQNILSDKTLHKIMEYADVEVKVEEKTENK